MPTLPTAPVSNNTKEVLRNLAKDVVNISLKEYAEGIYPSQTDLTTEVIIAQVNAPKTERINSGSTPIDDDFTVLWEIPYTCTTNEEVLAWEKVFISNPRLKSDCRIKKLEGKDVLEWKAKRMTEQAVERSERKMIQGFMSAKAVQSGKFRPSYMRGSDTPIPIPTIPE
jgi:hypothetical protein